MSARARAEAFCQRFGHTRPILMAPMAGACPPGLAIAVGEAGGMGACGALLMQPDAIRAWAKTVRAATSAPFMLNTWIPDPPPARDADNESRLRIFLERFGPPVTANDTSAVPPDFDAQCAAMIEAKPAAISSIMGLYAPEMVDAMKAAGIAWFATATTVAEARAAEAAGADAVVAQGMEAGGHRGSFEAERAGETLVGLFALVPAIRDAVDLPVIAAGGIADGPGVAAALTLGASAVQVGTGLLRSPEAGIAPAWAEGIARAAPEDTSPTRAFSGRLGRSLRTAYVEAAAAANAPMPAPYPVQRALTQPMRDAAVKADDLTGLQAWAGQSSALAKARPAGEIVEALWTDAMALLPG